MTITSMREGVAIKPAKKASGDKVSGPASYLPSIERTYGRPIAEWKKLIRSSPLSRHSDLVDWLKAGFGIGHGHTTALVAHTLTEDKVQS